MLYKAYQDFEEQGVFDEKLEELYREGKQHVSIPSLISIKYLDQWLVIKNWRPPVSTSQASLSTTIAGVSAPRPFVPSSFGSNSATPIQSPYSPTLYPTSQPTPPIHAINPFSNNTLPPHRFANFSPYQQQWRNRR